ncbi:hypothetical protein Tco_1163473 [Tanacetum coccineum]
MLDQEDIHKDITILLQAVAATEGNPAIQQHTTIETVLNMTPENKEHFLSEKEAIFLLLTGIGDDIYSTVDAWQFGNQRTITGAGTRETVRQFVSATTGIQSLTARDLATSKGMQKPIMLKTKQCCDERAALANLIANLTLDTEENKTILKQLKKANASLTQELEECKTNLDETSRALGEATSCRDSCLIAFRNKQNKP